MCLKMLITSVPKIWKIRTLEIGECLSKCWCFGSIAYCATIKNYENEHHKNNMKMLAIRYWVKINIKLYTRYDYNWWNMHVDRDKKEIFLNIVC